jgi:hypothetical protein
MAEPTVAPSQSERRTGNSFPFFLLMFLILILVGLVVFGGTHWNYKFSMSATPETITAVKPDEVRQAQAVVPPVECPLPTPEPSVNKQLAVTETARALPVVVIPPKEETPVVVQPKPKEEPDTTKIPDKYVNIVIVNWDNGVVMFPVFQKVPVSSIVRDGKMTKFTYNGKPNIVFFRVLESDTYTNDENEQIGSIFIPNPDLDGKMTVWRPNQSQRDVYTDKCGMYFKKTTDNGSVVCPAPEQASWCTRAVTIN